MAQNIYFCLLEAGTISCFVLRKKVPDSNMILKKIKLEVIDGLAAESTVLKRETKVA